jgi:hypothetical protein
MSIEIIKQFVQQIATERNLVIKDDDLTMTMAVQMYSNGLVMHDGNEQEAVEFAKRVVMAHFEDHDDEEEEEEEEDTEPAKEGECVYCKAEAVYECDRCKEAEGSDGGAMCRACAKEHGREVGSSFLCGGCFEEHGHEYEEEEEEEED